MISLNCVASICRIEAVFCKHPGAVELGGSLLTPALFPGIDLIVWDSL